MTLGNSKKILKIVSLTALVLLVVGGFLLYWTNRSSEPVEQDVETEILSDNARQSLENGSCSDSQLAEIDNNVAQYVGTSSEEKSLRDKADCYLQRQEYENAKTAFEQLQQFYNEEGNTEYANSTAEVIKNIDFYITTPLESQEEVDTGEPLAN